MNALIAPIAKAVLIDSIARAGPTEITVTSPRFFLSAAELLPHRTRHKDS